MHWSQFFEIDWVLPAVLSLSQRLVADVVRWATPSASDWRKRKFHRPTVESKTCSLMTAKYVSATKRSPSQIDQMMLPRRRAKWENRFSSLFISMDDVAHRSFVDLVFPQSSSRRVSSAVNSYHRRCFCLLLLLLNVPSMHNDRCSFSSTSANEQDVRRCLRHEKISLKDWSMAVDEQCRGECLSHCIERWISMHCTSSITLRKSLVITWNTPRNLFLSTIDYEAALTLCFDCRFSLKEKLWRCQSSRGVGIFNRLIIGIDTWQSFEQHLFPISRQCSWKCWAQPTERLWTVKAKKKNALVSFILATVGLVLPIRPTTLRSDVVFSSLLIQEQISY